MKDLNESVKEIMAMKVNNTRKRVLLKGLSLTDCDINTLFAIERMSKPREERTARTTTTRKPSLAKIIEKMTFGVEIECFNIRPYELVASASAKGLSMQSEGYNHQNNDHYYKLVSDASIQGEHPIECVSPILKGGESGFESLKNCCSALNDCYARVNRSTGLHVHIGYADITDEHYINVFKNYQKLESAIDAFMSVSRRGDSCQWARTLVTHDLSNCQTKVDVYKALGGYGNTPHRDSVRYHKVNPCSFFQHGTIEFRQHQGSTNYEKIAMWARFCLKLVAWSKNNVLTDAIADITKVPFLTKEEKVFFKTRSTAL